MLHKRRSSDWLPVHPPLTSLRSFAPPYAEAKGAGSIRRTPFALRAFPPSTGETKNLACGSDANWETGAGWDGALGWVWGVKWVVFGGFAGFWGFECTVSAHLGNLDWRMVGLNIASGIRPSNCDACTRRALVMSDFRLKSSPPPPPDFLGELETSGGRRLASLDHIYGSRSLR